MKRLANQIFIQAAMQHRRYHSIFADDEIDDEVDPEAVDNSDTEFGDPDDTKLSGDLEADFEKVVEQLRKTSYTELPQKLEDIIKDPKLYALLKDGFGDGKLADVHMSSSTVGIPVTQLLPSQSEIGLDNSLAYPLANGCKTHFSDGPITILSPIITYRKTFIVDGHHRWSQIYMINPKAKVSAINFNYQETSPYRILRNFQGAIAVAAKKVPSNSGGDQSQNVYAMSESAIIDYIDEHMQDVCLNDLIDAGVCKDRDGAIEYITRNVLDLKDDNPPFSNAPAREFMPQTDKAPGSVEIAKEGQTNI